MCWAVSMLRYSKLFEASLSTIEVVVVMTTVHKRSDFRYNPTTIHVMRQSFQNSSKPTLAQ
jgi:hypothetical protein